MQVHIARRHDCWDDAMEALVAEEVRRVRHCLRREGVRATSLHLTMTEEGQERALCSARLRVPGLVLSSRVSRRGMVDALQSSFTELLYKIGRHRALERDPGGNDHERGGAA